MGVASVDEPVHLDKDVVNKFKVGYWVRHE
jgi:hypothetical protein